MPSHSIKNSYKNRATDVTHHGLDEYEAPTTVSCAQARVSTTVPS